MSYQAQIRLLKYQIKRATEAHSQINVFNCDDVEKAIRQKRELRDLSKKLRADLAQLQEKASASQQNAA